MTAHDPRVTLTEEQREGICICAEVGSDSSSRATDEQIKSLCDAFADEVERIIAARLARVRAVAEQWDTGCGREVLAALDAPQDDAWDEPARHCHCGRAIPCRQHPPQDAPHGPEGGEQGAENIAPGPDPAWDEGYDAALRDHFDGTGGPNPYRLEGQR